MWHTTDSLPAYQSTFLASATELLQTTSRNLILATGGVYLVWLFFAVLLWPEELGWKILLTMPVIVLTCALPLSLFSKNLLQAQFLWQVGVAGTITLAIYLFQQPEVAFFYALLPLMAVVTVGWQAGLLAQGGITGLVWWVSSSAVMPPLSGSFGLVIVVSGILAGLLGWASINTLLTAVEWYLYSFTRAQQNMEAAEQSRAQLAEALNDLDRAYFRLQRSNAALVAARKAAEEANRFKAEFVTNVSHELRTPLNLIAGFSEVMLSSPESYNDLPIPGPYRSDLDAIHRSAQHLLALADGILDLARIEVGKISLTREQTDLAALISDTVDIFREYIAAKGLELKIELAVDLPLVWIDRLRIREVLVNLLVNAARFTEQGWISVEAFPQQGEVVVQITDTGRGIAKEELPRIFEEFHTTEQPTTAFHPGTGLGLPISKKFVELHGGEMKVESIHRQGTTFSFALPLTPAAQVAEPRQPDYSQPEVRLETPEQVIVVVHDDPQVASLLQRYMDKCRVVGVTDMVTGVSQAEELQAVALVAAPDPDGQAPPHDGVVIRCPLPDSRRIAASLGAVDILTKPVSRQRLQTTMASLERPVERIVIADDDPDMVRLYRRILRTQTPAPACLEAYNGLEALKLIRQEKPDLIVLDLTMPEMDGQTVLKELAANSSLADIPVIIASAHIEDYIDTHFFGSIQISQRAGFQLGDVVRILQSTVTTLNPGWD